LVIITNTASLTSIPDNKPEQLRESVARPKISVLMPVYNNAPFLGDAVESILSQSFPDFEFVIIDDGSIDGSPEIAATYACKDSRIRLQRNAENMGIVFSLNRGLKECRGDYIIRMDSDDIALPERFKKQLALMEDNPELVVSGTALSYMDARGRDLGVVRRGKRGASLLAGNPLFHPTVIIRREALLRHAFSYREEYRYAEDYFLWLQLSRVGKLGSLDEVLLHYRISSGASRIRNLKKMLWATLRVKWAGVSCLGLRPKGMDILKFIAETALLLLPASLILRIYQEMTFGVKVKLQL
jgi:glycosyltransferase involved in cell wall biosynthesis